jgi:hypothetical protein
MTLSDRHLAILNHVVEDGQSWADNALKEDHVLAKIAKYESAYDNAVAKGDYKNRKQRDEAEAKAEQDKIDNAPYNVKRSQEYPHFKDYLDAIVKGDDTQKQKYIDDCKAVKLKYPKN